MTAYCLRL